ncbi:phage tail tube assembly chaperone [Pediococcus acidilactici]|uniref:phage tail tube assembly chaperone n=1 Tax=Pediococcus acidilactici TaxID=1254 RepID=UPI0018AB484E|nr:phage tail tube assembly chaperone [Pediococcus acidilactici]
MQMKIKSLGMKKAVKVKENIHNQNLIMETQLALLKMQDDTSDEMTMVEEIEPQLKLTKQVIDFIKTILKLDDKKVKQIEEDLSFDDLADVVSEIILRFQGATDEDIEKVKEEQKKIAKENQDPLEEKSDSEKSE